MELAFYNYSGANPLIFPSEKIEEGSIRGCTQFPLAQPSCSLGGCNYLALTCIRQPTPSCDVTCTMNMDRRPAHWKRGRGADQPRPLTPNMAGFALLLLAILPSLVSAFFTECEEPCSIRCYPGMHKIWRKLGAPPPFKSGRPLI